jgi:hypothetical protein
MEFTKMNNVKWNSNILTIGDKIITFKYPIQEIVVGEQQVFVLIETPLNMKQYDYDDLHNVYCYSYDGNKLWQIGSNSVGNDDMYVGLTENESKLFVNDFLGRRFRVDKNTGKLSDMTFAK